MWKGVLKKSNFRGVSMAQLVKHPILDFGSGHDLRVVRLRPASGSSLGVESA